MKDTKNAQQNNKTRNLFNFIKILSNRFRSKESESLLKNSRKDKLIRIYFFILCGFVAALSIQEQFAIEQLLGGFLISCLLIFILYRDIMRYKPAYLKKYNMLFLLGLLLTGTLLIGRLFGYLLLTLSKGLEYETLESAFFGIPIPAGAMLVSLLFDFHTAITFSFAVSMLVGLWLHDASFTIYAFVGSITAAFSVIRCKKRSSILKGGGYVIAANVFTVIIILLINGELFTIKAPSSIMFAALGGIAVAAIVSLLLPLIEYAFKVYTDISLLELLDLDQPVMKNLMVTAPGTYHHSVIVGNLVESAAEAVGANPLLARVSAYYHDIGKIKIPDYFIENQSGSVSKHDKLTPHMSSMIIINHVKEGVEVARQYKLPEPIIDIIEQHHGTMLVSYFYQKAKEKGDDIVPMEEDYRYHGPKPQTRMAALIMMADAVEAASKVLTDPTPARISSLVDRIINHIFLDAQLDECELTLKDIHEVKKRFSYILTGIFHKRIDYPGFDFTDEDLYKEPAKTPKNKSTENNKSSKEGIKTARSLQG
ncbi:MAG: HDIG domain-containing protein [Nitrospirae bacterium]|jgi:cyclic-di-AMP phosphodiesterase PgpH|nr:HDIG domain-containing protein [Nitrospirota bacterium]